MKRVFIGIQLPKAVRDHVAQLSQRLASSSASSRLDLQQQQLRQPSPPQSLQLSPQSLPLSSQYSFTHPHLFHITLHFIGDATLEQINALCTAIETHFSNASTAQQQQLSAFTMRLGSASASVDENEIIFNSFPSITTPRVLFATTSGTSSKHDGMLAAVQATVARICNKLQLGGEQQNQQQHKQQQQQQHYSTSSNKSQQQTKKQKEQEFHPHVTMARFKQNKNYNNNKKHGMNAPNLQALQQQINAEWKQLQLDKKQQQAAVNELEFIVNKIVLFESILQRNQQPQYVVLKEFTLKE